MSSLNTEKIIQLAKEKTAEKEKLALDTIEEMRGTGQKVTFYSVAKSTGLSKTFLYNNEPVREMIEDVRSQPTDKAETQSETSAPDAEELIATLEQMKTKDPESYNRIRSALLDTNVDGKSGEGD